MSEVVTDRFGFTVRVTKPAPPAARPELLGLASAAAGAAILILTLIRR